MSFALIKEYLYELYIYLYTSYYLEINNLVLVL